MAKFRYLFLLKLNSICLRNILWALNPRVWNCPSLWGFLMKMSNTEPLFLNMELDEKEIVSDDSFFPVIREEVYRWQEWICRFKFSL
jgi:hypothetical protein